MVPRPLNKLIMGLCACKKRGTASRREGDAKLAPADSGSRERALSWLFEELQLDEVMVFVAKLVTFLVVCGICSVTTVAVGLLP